MSLFPNSKIIISFGSFQITWYAILILTGALIGYAIAQKTMKKWGYSHEVLEDYILPLLLLGILGARAYYVIFQWDYYSVHPEDIVAVWKGGLAIHGGLIVGAIFSFFYFKKLKISFFRMFDCIMPSVALAQAFGRWGNFANQEAYGNVVSEGFYNHFPSFIKNQMFIDGAYRQPTFLYESCLDLGCFLFIYFIFRRFFYRRRGDCGWMYLVWYGIARFIVEGFRTDSLMAGGLKMAQIVSIVFVIIGTLGLLGVFHKKQKPVVLFDLDGTLIDSQELVFDTFKEVFKRRKPDYELTKEELYSFLGPTLEQSFIKYFDESEVTGLIDLYQEINQSMHDECVKQIPHVQETLKELKEMDIPMAVVSNKRIKVVHMGLKAAHIESYFDVVLGMEDLPKSKPSPLGLIEACYKLNLGHDDCIYIGDNPSDVQAAKNMAAYSVGFSVDAKQRKQLEACEPCRVISDLYELVSIVKEDQIWSDNTIW